MIQARAGYQLHGVERAAIGQRAGLIDGYDGRMFEASDELRFAGQRGVQDLDCHRAVEFAVVRRIHHAQSPAADLGF
jgi:hypothetical protein